MIKNIFFDSDGTLYDEKPAKVKAEVYVSSLIANEANMPLNKTYSHFIESKKYIMDSMEDESDRNNRKLWYNDLMKKIDLPDLTANDLCDVYWNTMIENIEPYYDALIVLPELSRKYKLWILTDELYSVQKRKIEKLGILDLFKGIISSTHVGFVKPDARLFEYALKRSGSEKTETVMIGDNPKRDIKGANNSGIKSIFFRRGRYFYYPLEGDTKPDYIIKDFIGLPELISSF